MEALHLILLPGTVGVGKTTVLLQMGIDEIDAALVAQQVLVRAGSAT